MKYENMSIKDAFKQCQERLFGSFNTARFANTSKLVKDSDDGLYFSNALERIDPYLHRPLSRFYWQETMPILYGGGAVEFASFFTANYNVQDANKNAASGNGNIIATVQASIQKHQTTVNAYAWAIEIGWIDEMKYNQVGSNILQLVDEGVRLYYNQKLDDIAFYGFVKQGVANAYGLINNAQIASQLSQVKFTDAATTPKQIVDTLNTLLAGIAQNTAYSRQYVTNHLLLPPEVYTALAQPMTITTDGGAVFQNVLEYFKANNYVKMLFGSDDLIILPVPYLKDAGAQVSGAATRRAVAYCYNEACVRMPLPMDLTRGATMFDTTSMSIKTPFVAFIGSPQFVYPITLAYMDNI